MDSYFFRVEHDLLRSGAFKTLGGSAIKVYLVIGLYSDFGSGWAYPSIRTIARQAGLSRQTVLVAIEELTSNGLLATSKSQGQVDRLQDHPRGARAAVRQEGEGVPESDHDCPRIFRGGGPNCPRIFRGHPPDWSQNLSRPWPNSSARAAPRMGPNENKEREKTTAAASPSPGPRSASRPKGGSSLLLIFRNS